MPCKWPSETCACYAENISKPDYAGRVWMHCEEGLRLSKTSMSRFVMHCLQNNIEIGDICPFAPTYPGSQVSASIKLRPEQFAEFEAATKGKLRKPPKLSVNASSGESLGA